MGAAVVNILPFCNSVVTVQPSCQGVLDGQSKQRQTPPEPPNPSDSSRDRSRTLRVNSLSSRSEEHTSELQSRLHLVCRLLLEKKKTLYMQDSLTVAIITNYRVLLSD